jgi:RHS repeat-associated protein
VKSYTAHATGTSAITDNLGSVTNLIDTSGATQARYAYDPYGNQVSQSGGEDLLSLLGYTGALADPAPDQGAPATGCTHLGNRWQNPATATFTQQDNINKLASPASANTYANNYAYAADNPANYIAPPGSRVVARSAGSLLAWA